jgi:SAM-dependent methyltransferase
MVGLPRSARATLRWALPRSVRYRLRPGSYRTAVGGLWDELGALQFDYLVAQGLKPEHRLLDVGCGSLRGGLRFIAYLDTGNYHGIDISSHLLAAGRRELAKAGLAAREPHLIVDDAFRFGRFSVPFDYALAVSVFTHLPFNVIMRCLTEVERVLVPGGRFYATFYLNHGQRLNVAPYKERAAGTTTIDSDPFYYDPDIFRWAVAESSLDFTLIGDWKHPRNQQLMLFTKRA